MVMAKLILKFIDISYLPKSLAGGSSNGKTMIPDVLLKQS